MERTNPQAWEDGDPGPMKLSERLNAMRNADWRDGDALRPMNFDDLQRAERVVRDGGGGPMFSEHETYADFHFGTDIPTGAKRALWYDGTDEMIESRVVEITHDAMPIEGWGDAVDHDAVVRWRQVVVMAVLVAWVAVVWGVGAACGWW